MSLDDLAKLSDFISELEDLCKERSIGFMDGIPAPMEGSEGWWVIIRFEVGRPESPPDLGVRVSDGIGADDIFGGG